MRFKLFIVGFALLTIVSALPIKNLKDDLKEIAEQTDLEIKQEKVRLTLTLVKLIVDKKIADQTELENWRVFLDEWGTRKDSWLQDATLVNNFNKKLSNFLPKVPLSQLDIHLDEYTGGAYSNIDREFKDFKENRFALFQTTATKKIQMAKDNGYNDNLIDNAFEEFVRTERHNRDRYFNALLVFLKNK